MTADARVIDKSSDQKYFTQTPQLVWALCDDPFEYTLWNVIKMVAGETGECILSTQDLATMTMASAGKVSQCRKRLLEKGLLEGEVRRDPGYPQPVWHLTIPDLWPANVAWRQNHHSLKDRIRDKREGKGPHHVSDISLHHVKPSPREGGTSPREGGTSPRETKKNQEEEPEEQPMSAGALPSPSELTVAEIKDLRLTRAQWQALRKRERDGKNRVTALRYIDKKLERKPLAIDVYHNLVELYPPKALWDDIGETIGESADSIDLWRRVIKGWLGAGWNKRNVNGMIDRFKSGDIPGKNGGNHDNGRNRGRGRNAAQGAGIPPLPAGRTKPWSKKELAWIRREQELKAEGKLS